MRGAAQEVFAVKKHAGSKKRGAEKARKAVFLDRDGTINMEREYLSRVQDLQLIQGAAHGLTLLRRAGFRLIVVSNQSGVARGFFNEQRVLEINKALAVMLEREGAGIDAWYYCPHHPDSGAPPYRAICPCRKPATGMVDLACREMHVDLSCSFVVGDTMRDMELAWNCGMGSVLVKTGHGMDVIADTPADMLSRIDYIAADMLDAAGWIVAHEKLDII